MPRPLRRGRDWTPEQWQQATVDARRAARYKFAEQRIRQIVAGDPPLSVEQRGHLARLLLQPRGDGA
jgi:hypothetical protein